MLNKLPQRKMFTKQRRALSTAEKRRMANGAVRQLNHQHLSRKMKHVGIYIDDFGELPTLPLFLWLKRRHINVYLPCVSKNLQGNILTFKKINSFSKKRMARHRLGMLEPRKGRGMSVKELDVLFLPLTIVDQQGNRMGMGGGFYDRTLKQHAKFSTHKKVLKKPRRIGWCYDFQLVCKLDAHTWDVPVHTLVTPSKICSF